jgi:hypothetical protein
MLKSQPKRLKLPHEKFIQIWLCYQYVLGMQTFWVFMLVQDMAFGLAKLSVLFFYRRIFFTRTFKALSMALIVLVIMWSLGFFSAYLFRCGTHFWALWAPLIYLVQYCYDSAPMFQALGVSDVVTDILILSLPLFWVGTGTSGSELLARG